MSKGNTKIVIVAALVLLTIVSWYSLFSNSKEMQNQYDNYLKTAREKAELEIFTDAISNYNSALGMKDTLKLRSEIADFYYEMGTIEGGGYKRYVDWCYGIIDRYPYEKEGYERLAKYYKDNENYYSCYAIINDMNNRKVSSKKVSEIAEEIKYTYEKTYAIYDEIGDFYKGFCPVKKTNAEWGYVNNSGKNVISCVYEYAGNFSDSGKAPVKNDKGKYVIIDTSTNIKHADAEKRDIEDCTPFISNKMSIKYDGKYHYSDIDFNVLFGEYDFAGTFNCGVAAVCDDGEWFLIDESGKKVGKNVYEDIKVDHVGIAFRNDVAFAKKDGKYILINTKGEQVGKSSWDDADVFNSDQYAAVCKDGKWGYIDSSGKEIIEPIYEDAKSFANGLAAVCDDDKWGYINYEEKEIKITCEFEDAKDFTDQGTAFVKINDKWTLIKLYRLN